MDLNEFFRRCSQPSPFPPGTRIRLLSMPNDPDPVPVGSTGTVEDGSTAAQLSVKWDNGRSLMLLPGVDRYEVLPLPPDEVPLPPDDYCDYCEHVGHTFRACPSRDDDPAHDYGPDPDREHDNPDRPVQRYAAEP